MNFSWELFNTLPIVGILRRLAVDVIDPLSVAALHGGLTTIEVTVDSPDFAEAIKIINEKTSGKMNVGAGTVCNLKDLNKALNAGAGFIVTPNVDTELIKVCRSVNIPVFAGAYTPSEIYEAWSAGADMVKVFPADQLGPAFIRNVKAPFPQIKLLPTGGVTLETLPAYIKAGASGFGISGPIFSATLIADEKWEDLAALVRQFVDIYNETIFCR